MPALQEAVSGGSVTIEEFLIAQMLRKRRRRMYFLLGALLEARAYGRAVRSVDRAGRKRP